MRPRQALLAFAVTALLGACSASDQPLVPPLGTKVPPVPAEGLDRPGRTHINRISSVCSMPKPSPDAEFRGVMVSSGTAISNIAVNGQDDLTSAVFIHVEQGDTPLYLMALSGSPVLWIVEGATDRVERLIVQPSTDRHGPGVAVKGLPASRVGALPPNACGAPYDLKHGAIKDLLIDLRRMFRRDDITMVGYENVGTVLMPSGKQGRGKSSANGPMITTDAGTYVVRDSKPVQVNPNARNFTAMQFKRFYPNGVAMVHPETVVSTRPVKVYDVLPAEAGLIQLVEAGALTFVPEEGGYLINGPIPRFPAGLDGAHSVKFGLAEGVGIPKGSLNHSSLFDAPTGKCLAGMCKSMEEMQRREKEISRMQKEYERRLRQRR